MTQKYFDIVVPKDNWERGYAHLAYLHEGLRQVFATKIPVDIERACVDCGASVLNAWVCEPCDHKNINDEDYR